MDSINPEGLTVEDFIGVCALRDHDVKGARGIVLIGLTTVFCCEDCLVAARELVKPDGPEAA